MDWVLIYYLCLAFLLFGIPICKSICERIRSKTNKETDEQDFVSVDKSVEADTVIEADENAWVFCAVGNIKKQHIGPNGEIFYGSKAFSGGTKVYIYDKSFGLIEGRVTVLGLSRFSRYVDESVPFELIENVRLQRIFKPGVLEAMEGLSFDGYWWRGRTSQDKKELKAFVEMWNCMQEDNFKWKDLHTDPVTGFKAETDTFYFGKAGTYYAEVPYMSLSSSGSESILHIAVEDFELFSWCISDLFEWFDEYECYEYSYEQWNALLSEADKLLSFETFDLLFDYRLSLYNPNVDNYRGNYFLSQMNYSGVSFWKSRNKYKQQLDDIKKWTELVLRDTDTLSIDGV